MAVRYYGISVGGQAPANVTIDSSTTSSDIELAVDDTNVPRAGQNSKDTILEALETLRLTITNDDY